MSRLSEKPVWTADLPSDATVVALINGLLYNIPQDKFTGPQGPKGDDGADGAKGDKGDPGPSVWGGITGTLSTQTDLQNALDLKATVTQAERREFVVAVTDEVLDLTTGTGKLTFSLPYNLTIDSSDGVILTVTTAPTNASIEVDIKVGGVSIFTVTPTIDSTEKTSRTAATQYILDTDEIADTDIVTVDIVQVGATIAGVGLKIALIGGLT